MAGYVPAAGVATALSATGTVRSGQSLLLRIICSSGTSPSIQIYDNTAASGTLILDTTVMTAGQSIEVNAMASNGIHAVLAGTTPKFTVVFAPQPS